MDWVMMASTLLALLMWRIWRALPSNAIRPRRTRPCKTCIVLGSGGHTAEMLQLVSGLAPQRYSPRVFVIANTDHLSEAKARQHPDARIYRIPRAREVGQGWASVPWSTLRALIMSVAVILQTMPDVILCNGPGSCIPLCMAAYIPRILGIKSIQIVYVESFARVKTLSLTGKLLYSFADLFLVQWPDLIQKYPRAQYTGPLV